MDDIDKVAGVVYLGSYRDPPTYQWSVNTSVFIREDARSKGLGPTPWCPTEHGL